MWSCLLHVSTFKSSESLLVSAMSSGVGCRRHSISSWLRLSRLRRVNFYLPVFLLAFVVSGTNATSCPFPCNPASQCVSLDPSSCQHGVVKDVCECCDVCGHGPGDFCGPYGKCGEGLVCVQGYEEGLSEEDLRDYPSFCELAPASTAPSTTEVLASSTPSPTTRGPETATPSPATGPPSNYSNSSSTDHPVQTEPASGMPDTCRQPCSVGFCSDKARICSAAGLEFRKVARRNGCQHTSCYACYLLVKPDCDSLRCAEPPTKRCLRTYFECIRDHYFSPLQPNSDPVMLSLDDTRASSRDGQIICHVPEVVEDTWSAG